jgi:hypothetical protein
VNLALNRHSVALAESGFGKEGLQLLGGEVSAPDGRQMRANKARLIFLFGFLLDFRD